MKRTGVAGVMVVAQLVLVVSSTLGVAQEAKSVQAVLKAPGGRTLAPEFALKDTTGRIVRLSEYRGRVVLLDFWATTCGGCIQEIPMFIEVAKAYERRGLTTIGVSEDIAYAGLKNADEAWDRVRPSRTGQSWQDRDPHKKLTSFRIRHDTGRGRNSRLARPCDPDLIEAAMDLM